jgi:malonate-semialdehyde dehydrogenase (acetylating) / methylmalonate-semialdehyde dehydrogenase
MPEVELLSTPAPEAAALELVGSRIAGEVLADPTAPFSEVFDPATGEVTRRVAHADDALVDRAVQVATGAWRSDWRDAAQNRRFAMLIKLRALVVEHRDEFVALIVSEGGKARPDAEGELNRALDGLDSAFSMPVSLQGAYGEQVARGIDTYALPHPLGVVATITPFNFPLMIPLWDAAAALACGNAIIHKPSPRVPSAALLLAELIEQAGVPAGVYNVLQGEAATVNALLDHPNIAAASFVGSTPVAQHIYTRGSAAGKRVQAMGGAKNHVVVMPDADMTFTADSLVSGAFGSTGQRCMAVTLAVAVGEAADRLREEIVARIPALKVGPGSEPENEMGPVISRASQERVLDLIARGEQDGAELVIDGRPLAGESPGFFVGPTLFDRVTTGMSIYDTEIFGPVLGIVRVDTLDEALAMIEANPYGNGSSIFTASGAAARRFQREAAAGMVGVNVPIPVPVNSFSTGGWKASVFGAHGLLGPEAFRFYTHQKIVTARWPESGAQSMGMAFNPGR